MTVLFLAIGAVVIVGTALALAGRWQPQGLAEPGESSQPGADPARFDIVLRGYRMDQVDDELARLRALVGEQSAGRHEEAPSGGNVEGPVGGTPGVAAAEKPGQA